MKNKIKMLLNIIELTYDQTEDDFNGINEYDIVREIVDVIEKNKPKTELRVIK